MADNVELDAGSGGAVIATDDDGVAQHQYVKLEAGADGTQTKIHAGGGVEANALRVTVASDSTGVLSVDDNGGSLTVDGTVAVSGTVAVTDNAGSLTVDDGGSSLTVDGTVAATQSGTWTLGANSGVDVGDVTINNSTGASAVNIQDGGNSITVDGTVAATQSGTWNVGTTTTVTTVGTLTGGGVAHDGADSGNPVKVGMKAGTADITAVANNDRTDMRADTLGHQVIRPYALHENLVSGGTVGTPLTNTTSTSMIASAGAGRRNYITAITVTNAHATVGTVVQIRDGSGGTILWEGYAAPVGGGVAISFPTPLRGSAATAVHGVCVTTGSSTSISVSGYTSAV